MPLLCYTMYFCTWFLAFICEFVLFVDVEQHSLLARLCFMFCFISNDVFVSIRNVELRPIGNDYCVGPISMKRWTKTLISAERIKQTTPLITEKKPNLVFGLGTDQTHHNFLGPLSVWLHLMLQFFIQ